MTKSIKLNIRTASGEGTIEMEGNIESVEGKVIDRFFDSLQTKEVGVCQPNPVSAPEKKSSVSRATKELDREKITIKSDQKKTTTEKFGEEKGQRTKKYFYSTDDGSDKRGVIDSKTRRALESIFLKSEQGESVTPEDLEDIEKKKDESETKTNDNTSRGDRYTSDIIDRNTNKPMELFRCDYICPSCGHRDSRFAAIRNSYVKCFNCSSHLALEEAVPGEFTDEFISGLRVPVQDENGAYYIARDFKEQ